MWSNVRTHVRRSTRHGTERHLVCIEDPFELSHDLGRTIDRNSVVVSCQIPLPNVPAFVCRPALPVWLHPPT